jgi:hypothetical protein
MGMSDRFRDKAEQLQKRARETMGGKHKRGSEGSEGGGGGMADRAREAMDRARKSRRSKDDNP